MINQAVANGAVQPRGFPTSASGVGPPAMNEWKQSHPVPKSTVCADEITQKMSGMLAFQQTLKPSPTSQRSQIASTAISRFVPHRVIAKVSGVWGKLQSKSSNEGDIAHGTHRGNHQCTQTLAHGQSLPLSLSHIPASHSISSILTLEIRLNEGHNLNRKKVQQIVGGGVNRKPVADEGKSIRCGRYVEDPFTEPIRRRDYVSAVQQSPSQTLTDRELLSSRSPHLPQSDLVQIRNRVPAEGEPREAEPQVLVESRPAMSQTRDADDVKRITQHRDPASRERIRTHGNRRSRRHQGHANSQRMSPSQKGHARREHMLAQQDDAVGERALKHNDHAARDQTSSPDDDATREELRAHHNRVSQEGTPARRSHITHRRMPAYDDRINREHMPADYDRLVLGSRRAGNDDDNGDARRQSRREPRVRFQLSQDAQTRSRARMTSSRGLFESETGFEEDLDDRILSTLPVGFSTPRYAAQTVEMPRPRDQRRSRQGPSPPPPDHSFARPGDAVDSSEDDSIESQSVISLEVRDKAVEEAQEDGKAGEVQEVGETQDVGEAQDFGESQAVQEAQEPDDARGAREVAYARPRSERTRTQREGEMRRLVGMKKHPSPSKQALEDLSAAFEHYYYLKTRGAGDEVDELAKQWASPCTLPPQMRNRLIGNRLQAWESASSFDSESQSTPRAPPSVEGEDAWHPPTRLPHASRFDQIPRLPHAHPPLSSQKCESSEWQ